MGDLSDLTADEQRVLGSLLEKEVTVPASYPMSVNAVRTACNQTSSREPVVDYDERHVHEVLRSLKSKNLVAVTWSDTGRRTMKYVQTVAVRLDLAADERALLTVLMLRGPQAPGALKSRTERLHSFTDREEVASCLARMASRDSPLVAEQPKRPREQDHRWVHLLGEAAAVEVVAGIGEPDLEVVLSGGADARDDKVRAAYGAVAASYADELGGELPGLPFERWLLDRVAAGAGPVIDAGCGPGHVTAYLTAAGADATGIDLTPEMVQQARRLHPEGTYDVRDLRELMRPTTASGWGAVVAWYSLIHLAPSEIPAALASLIRPLTSGGTLLLGALTGGAVRKHSQWFDHDVDLDVILPDRAWLVDQFERTELVDMEWYHRGPVAARGETTERLYILGVKP